MSNDRPKTGFTTLKGLWGTFSRGLSGNKIVMPETFELSVHLAFDGETNRWYIAQSDIPGLWLEADTAAELIGRIQTAAPEMIELNEAEIVQACREKKDYVQRIARRGDPRPRPSIRPIFDSPLFAHA